MTFTSAYLAQIHPFFKIYLLTLFSAKFCDPRAAGGMRGVPRAREATVYGVYPCSSLEFLLTFGLNHQVLEMPPAAIDALKAPAHFYERLVMFSGSLR